MAVSVLAFDLNGTLTDLSALDPKFRAEFGASRVRREWFNEALMMAFALTASGQYRPFSEILEAALKVIEERHELKPSSARRKTILAAMRSLPAFADVRLGLERLRSHGLRLVVLTNSGLKAAEEGLKSAGILQLFEDVFSAEATLRLKPAPEPYEWAARQCNVKPRDLLLVAAHSWDIAGAMHAGCRAAFVARPGQVLDEITPEPELIVSDLKELAEELV